MPMPMTLPLSAQAEVLEALFNHMPLGMAMFDRDMRVVQWNSAWARGIARYTATTGEPVVDGVRLLNLAPDTAASWRATYARALAGETVREEAVRTESEGIVSYWDVTLTPMLHDGEVVGVLELASDATERVHSYQGLEQRVAERTRELMTLLDVSHNMAATLELEPLLNLILDQLRTVVPFDGASILTLEGEDLQVVSYRGPMDQAEALKLHLPLASSGANRAVIERRAPVIIADVRGDSPLAEYFREAAGPALETSFDYIRSWLGVPLLHKERLIGMLSLDHSQAYYYTARHGQLALALAGQVAMAIENARLYRAEQERLAEAERRRAVAEGLRDILNVLNSDRPLDEILRYIVAQAGRLMGTDTGAIYRLDQGGELVVQASQGLSERYIADMKIPLGQGAVGTAVLQRRPVSVPIHDALIAVAAPDSPRAKHVRWLNAHFKRLLAVPLVIKNEIYGGIVLYFAGERELSGEEVALASSFGDQAALAIENARLREQAQRAAVAAERSRLARDLHDAVTQTLFSASLIAEVLPRLWDRQPAEARRRLDELRELTRGALAEMRTLLLELRPATLIEASFGDLLRQLAEATTGRARVPVKVTSEGQASLPPDVQIALYRIAQEALNNVAKHAGATEATVDCRSSGAGIDLTIADNGHGFDPAAVGAEHLGLGIMRERAAAAGIRLTLTSQPGVGTQIHVTWPA